MEIKSELTQLYQQFVQLRQEINKLSTQLYKLESETQQVLISINESVMERLEREGYTRIKSKAQANSTPMEKPTPKRIQLSL